jgi:hypothetical protein
LAILFRNRPSMIASPLERACDLERCLLPSLELRARPKPNPRACKSLIFGETVGLEVEEVRKVKNVKPTDTRKCCQSEQVRHSRIAR